ncbi:hypothetical protein H2200_011369 [Cladophialophora chaetospira]|uniref:Tachykinin family protein n=1 Tax=Cladophialophora chaetospira TaxID=386627 RepID=A0AA39CD25_9EURO|nr:hypothetical protein H2200_011369 [Cladophialophora chaetospira]
MVEIKFVTVKPGPGTESRRAQELRAAAARSHASRVSHIRAIQRKKELLRADGENVDVHHHQSTKSEDTRPANVLPYPDQSFATSTSHLETTLGQGRSDPFGSYDGSKLPHRLQAALEDAYEVVWPMMLEAKGEELAMIKRAWRSGAIHSPCLFHCQVMGAAGVAMAFCGNEALAQYFSHKRLEHQMIASRLIRQELERINCDAQQPTAELIMSILNLVGASGDINNFDGGEVHPKSPLAQAQPLGRAKIDHAHFEVVHALVKRIGGLIMLKAYALAHMIEVIDIYVASERGSRPVYAPSHTYQGLATSGKFIPDDHAVELAKVIGSGLEILASLDEELFELYLNAREVTVALDQYHRGAHGRPSLNDLVEARNMIQHGFCDLCSPPDPEMKPEAALYEICRLAGLLFSDMVILPLPYNSGVKPRLSHRLRVILEASSMTTCWMSAELCNLLLWIVFMGAIAATLTPDRDWYVQRLQELTERRPLDWHGFKRLMRTFLWWDFVFEVPAAKIWKIIQTSIAGGKSLSIRHKMETQQLAHATGEVQT